MRKWLAIIGILFASLLVHIDAQETARPASKAQAAQHPSPYASPVVVKKNDTPALQTDTAHEQPGSERKPFRVALPARDKYDWIAYGANLLLVAVGIGGVAIGVCTVLYIKAQVAEMKTQAGLMKTQADHMEAQTKQLIRQNQNMLAIERSWVVETIRFVDDIPRRDNSSGGGVLVAILVLKNIGKQPAFLKIIQTRFHTSNRLAIPAEFRSTEVLPDGFMLAPDQEIFVRVLLEEGSLDDQQVDGIEGKFGAPPLSLYIYGGVVYESVGVRGSNRFCYRWRNLMGMTLAGDKGIFEKAGPVGYNQHT